MQRRVAETQRHPIEGALNVLQTLQRGTTGLAAGMESGEGLRSLGHALFNMLNPDEGNDDLDKINSQVEGILSKAGGGIFSHKETPVEHFMGHLASQMVTDPVSFLPGFAVAKKSLMATKLAQEMARQGAELGVKVPGVARAIKVGNKVHDAYITHLGHEFHKVNSVRPELDEYLTPSAKTGRLGIEHRNIARMNDELGHSDIDLLKKHDKALRDVKATANKGYALPEDIRQRYLQEPWRYGTPEMRAQAEKLDYHPTEADKPWEKAPEGLLSYDLRKDYQYIGDPSKKLSNGPAFEAVGGRYGKKDAAFEFRRAGNWDGLEADQRARVAARLQMGRDFVRKRRVDQQTEAFLKKFGGWKSEKPQDVKLLSHSPKIYWQSSPFRAFSRLGKESILASFLPHLINNMGTLTFWQGGVPALARSAVYMVKGVSPEQIARIKSMGAHSDYSRDFEGMIGSNIPGVKEWLHLSAQGLNRGEMAMRQAILDQLDKTMGPSRNAMDEFQKAQHIRDALGDYRNVSAFISLMDAMGAPFAPFMGVFSKAAKHTLASDKAYRFTLPLRAQQDLNQQTEDAGKGDFTVPNPASAFSQLATGEGFLSPSRTGPLPQIISGIAANKTGNPQFSNLLEWLTQQAGSYGGPLASNVAPFFSMPYASPDKDPGELDPVGGLLHLFLGDYFKNPMSERPDMRINKAAERASEF